MKLGDVIHYYEEDNEEKPDYAIVTKKDTYRTWAYWKREKEVLTFTTDRPCYKRVGPSVLGKWQ